MIKCSIIYKKTLIFSSIIIALFLLPRVSLAESLSLEDVNSIKGFTTNDKWFGFTAIRDIFAIDNYVIISGGEKASSERVAIFDVSNKKAIKKLSSPKTKSNRPTGVFADKQYAYIASVGVGLEVFDISNPKSPSSVGIYNQNSDIEMDDVFVSQGYAYLTGFNRFEKNNMGEFHIVDLSDPTSLKRVSAIKLPTKGKEVFISGAYAYVADQSSLLYVIDISNPQQPNLVSQLNLSEKIEDVQVLNNTAYVVDATNEFKVVDLSDPLNPLLKTTYQLKNAGKNKDIFVSENRAFISGYKDVYRDMWRHSDGREGSNYQSILSFQGYLEAIDISNDNEINSVVSCDYWIPTPYFNYKNKSIPPSQVLSFGKYIYASYDRELVVIEKSANSSLKMCQKGRRNNDIIAESSIKPKVMTNGNKSIDYQSRVVKTSKGSYRAYMANFDLSNPKIKMLTVTASDIKHCGGMCNIKSLKSYVNENKALAGINGTQFRNLQPRDGPNAIAGNHFEHSLFYKSNKKRMHNEEKIRINAAPMIVFTSNQNWVFYRSNLYFPGVSAFEKQYNTKVQAAFSSADSYGSLIFVYNSKITKEALAFADSFSANVKTTRSIIALKGSKVYFIIMPRANYIDAAYAMQALGMEYAINLDGGGSSALYFKGQYKVGPGRNIPNAIVVAER